MILPFSKAIIIIVGCYSIILDVYISIIFRLLKFHKAYYDKEGLLVTEPLQCARHYLKLVHAHMYSIIPSFILCRTTFIFDFLASLPTDLLVFLLWPLGLGKSIHVHL